MQSSFEKFFQAEKGGAFLCGCVLCAGIYGMLSSRATLFFHSQLPEEKQHWIEEGVRDNEKDRPFCQVKQRGLKSRAWPVQENEWDHFSDYLLPHKHSMTFVICKVEQRHLSKTQKPCVRTDNAPHTAQPAARPVNQPASVE